MSDTIITVKHDLVTVLYLNRPQTLNCFNNELLETLASTLQKLDADPSVRCVVITGSGRGFCAGGDLGVLMDCDTQEKSDENMRVANEAVAALFRMKTPTIAMVNGAAAGAGFNLALACDMIFAAEKAKFIQSFVSSLFDELPERQHQRHKAAGDGSGTGAAVALEHVAVHGDADPLQLIKIHRTA